MNKAVFLDRDGTLNSDSSYINKVEDFEFYPYTVKALSMIKKNGYLLIVISNQSGVGRGFIRESELDKINTKMQKALEIESAKLDAIYYCFFYENAVEDKYRKNQDDRKPSPGMILKAARKFDISLKESYMIGDRESDILAGKNAGCKTVLVKTGDGLKTIEKIQTADDSTEPDFVFDSILEAAEFIADN